MALYLSEAEIEKFLTMELALAAVEEAFRLQGLGKTDVAPRRRCRLGSGLLHIMSASMRGDPWAGLKCYTSTPRSTRFHVLLYGGESGELLAILEADKLGQMRTGAASGVATKHMARKDARRLGVLGTGWQARAQIEAICAVRPIETVVVYGRDVDRRTRFCSEMTEKLGIGIYPASAPEEAVREMDVVVTATTSKVPVFQGEWLREGTHINAIGSNFLTKQEIDVETVRRSACVVVDSLEQARLESGDLALAAEAEAFFWEDARELGLVVVGDFPGREDDREITLFESHGIALEDIAVAGRVYEAAREAGAGKQLPF